VQSIVARTGISTSPW
jgi:hypothetical protein